MTVDADLVLLSLRIAFIVLVYLFLARLGLGLWRDVRRGAESSHTLGKVQGTGSLHVVEAASSGLQQDEALPLRDRTSLGRHASNTVVLEDDAVSQEHAVVTWRNDSWWIQDLGSTNGTLLNGRRISATTKLSEGDLVQIGRVKLRLGT